MTQPISPPLPVPAQPSSGQRLNLLPPILVSAAMALAGMSAAVLLPDRLLAGLAPLLLGGRSDLPDVAAQAALLRNVLSTTALVGWACSAAALLPFALPLADPFAALVRYFASLGLRVLFNVLAGAVLCLALGWPMTPVVIALALWYILLLFVGELPFIARFVLGLDATVATDRHA